MNKKRLWKILTKETLERELFQNSFRQTEIARKYNCSVDIVNRYIKRHSIIPKYSRKHYKQMRNKNFTQEQLDLVYGTLLGDGCLAKQYINGQYCLMIEHELKQEGYCLHKKEILSNFVLSHRYNKKNMCESISFQTIKHPKLTEIRHLLYKNNKKVITREYLKHINPKALAYWFMDDGTCSEQTQNPGAYNTYLVTCDYPFEEQVLVVDFLKRKFNLIANIRPFKIKGVKYYRLSFFKPEAIKLLTLIQSYIPHCMSYKLALLN
jgi:hypothetical protein